MATMTVMRMSPSGRQELRRSEGEVRNKDGWHPAYQCAADVWTIDPSIASTSGVEVRGMRNGQPYVGKVREGVLITDEEVDRLLSEHLNALEIAICKDLPPHILDELSQGQFDALVSWWWQYGEGAWHSSPNTLRDKVKRNPFDPSIRYEFTRWNRVAGKRNKGVYYRGCRRGFMWADLPIPEWLWRTSKLPWALDEHGEIDFEETPHIEDLLRMAKLGQAPTRATVTKEPQPIDEELFRPEPAEPAPIPEPHTREAEEEAGAPSPEPSPRKIPDVATRPEPAPQAQEVKDMTRSKRFWGHMITALGTLNFIPEAWRAWFNEGSNRELLIWVLVIAAGYAWHRYGVFKARHVLK